MRGAGVNLNLFTNATFCAAFLLTLCSLSFFGCPEAQAFTYDDDQTADTSAYASTRPKNLVDQQERQKRISLITEYAKAQIPSLTPGLPAYIREPGGWITRSLGAAAADDDTGDDGISSFIQPVRSAFSEPSMDAPEAMWISPTYHHKGFLPVNDAMIMGVHLRKSFSDLYAGHGLQLDMHPFYGQNWHSTDHYWGTEIALDIAGKDPVHPWGKIALRFTQGDSDLMDHGHGFDMHGQLNINERLSITSGIRENGISAAGDYVMMRWKMALE